MGKGESDMDMLDERAAFEPPPGHVRQRIALEVVEPGRARGLVIPFPRDGSITYSGRCVSDYACGGCGQLLAIGVRPGMFQSLVFACGCGALNQVP